jgi:Uma2 family endonuclease
MSNDTLIALNPLAVLKPTKEPRRYTLMEYLKKLDNSEELYEYYDGIITKLPMARIPHNQISTNFSTALNIAIEANGKNFRVLSGQQAVYLPALNVSIFPDVLVVTEKPLHWDTNEVLLINPILIVEVLSKGTSKYDRTEKFTKYKTLETLREYVLVDQKACYVESRFREEPNLWRDTIVTDIASSIYLKSIDGSIDITKIYKHVLP